MVDDTQTAEHMPVRTAQGGSGIEPDRRFTGHERIVARPRVGRQVRDDEEIGRRERVDANRGVQIGLAGRKADPRLEPLPIPGHQTDQSDRRVADQCRQMSNVVEFRLRRRIEQIERARASSRTGSKVVLGRAGLDIGTGGLCDRLITQLRAIVSHNRGSFRRPLAWFWLSHRFGWSRQESVAAARVLLGQGGLLAASPCKPRSPIGRCEGPRSTRK